MRSKLFYSLHGYIDIYTHTYISEWRWNLADTISVLCAVAREELFLYLASF